MTTNQQKSNLTFSLPQTGFEFKKRRAFSILDGVFMAQENEVLLREVRLALLPLSQQDDTKQDTLGEKPKSSATRGSSNSGTGFADLAAVEEQYSTGDEGGVVGGD